jgi:hypothetical protein
MSARSLQSILAALVVLLAVSNAAAQREWRAKIDRIDTSDAPNIRLFMTYLDVDGSPVNPELIDFVEVFRDGKVIPGSSVEISTWRDQPEGTDIVFIVPATGDVTDSHLKAVSEGIKGWVGALGTNDRVAVVSYSFSVEVLGDLSTDKGNGLGEYESVARKGVRPFMFSALDKAITLLETTPVGRKRAIVYIGDGSDAEPRLGPALSQKVEEVHRRAKKENVQIWTVAFGPQGINAVDTRTLQLLSRKTGATFRAATSVRQLKERLRDTIGEVVFQIVLDVHDRTEENTEFTWVVHVQAAKSPEVETNPYRETIGEVTFNYLLWGIISGLTCIFLVLATVITIVVVIKVRRDRARKEAEALLADLLEEREESCETCHRVQKPEWETCPFCAAGMPPLGRKQKAAPFVYDEQDRKLCNVCGRVANAEWAACAFCAQKLEPLPEWTEKKREEALLLGEMAPEDFAAQMQNDAQADVAAAQAAAASAAADAKERQEAIAKGGAPCGKCKRIKDPKWPECLYCASGLPPLE